MRDRRWRRLVDADRDRQPTTTQATGGGALSWLRKHIIGEIIGAALLVVVIGWVTGFFESILREVFPSAANAACALRETVEYQWPFAIREAPSDRFRRFRAKPCKKIVDGSSGEPELMEDAAHCTLNSLIVGVDRFWVV
jgi:hypothetical protein